ncbi:OLC1v1008338C1 [Oldenlandia corymbosa var. corymbosa]|uniref:OLC1v1008338C1 n=1 Tax=Oldenlandia corymbosa var. corymbosa TaxID=529605 RepID=A0AAV1DLF5_OLDCO|nr:OLC1v1008338C1 [Oldenlandia corymbosa var. corymbosa]
MAPRVKRTARRRTRQIQGIGFPWVHSVLPLLPIPDLEDNEEDKAEIQRHLKEPRDWNFFLTSLAWDFYKENRKRVAMIERCVISDDNLSTMSTAGQGVLCKFHWSTRRTMLHLHSWCYSGG